MRLPQAGSREEPGYEATTGRVQTFIGLRALILVVIIP